MAEISNPSYPAVLMALAAYANVKALNRTVFTPKLIIFQPSCNKVMDESVRLRYGFGVISTWARAGLVRRIFRLW